MKLKKELESFGAKVYLTRDGDYDMTKRNHHYSKQDDMYLRVKKLSWKMVLVALVVFCGTFFGSAIISHVVLSIQGII